MQFEVLASVRVYNDDASSRPAGRIQQRLLGMLLASANRPVSADVLTDALWGGVFDPRAVHKLHVHVHRLRQALGEPERLTFDASGYQLTVFPGELDTERFESTVDEGVELVAAGEPQRGAALLRKALLLWRGEPYQGLDLPQLGGEVQRLRDRRMAALVVLYEAEIACGRHDVVVAEVADLVARYPFSERLYELLMTAHALSGQRADALRVYQQAREAAVDELGIEPGPGLRDLEQQILAGEPLAVAEPVAATVQPARPAQLPGNVAGFVGRDDALAQLGRLASQEGESAPVVVVSGSGGVGKTALVVRWAHQVKEQFANGQLYVDLRGYGPDEPVEPSYALAGFLRALGVEGKAVPEELSERASLFRSLVDGRELLIVLDNANSAEQVHPLLPGAPTCTTVITSRDTLAGLSVRHGASQVSLTRMTDNDARLLLQELVGTSDDHEAVTRLTELCAGLPLALRIAVQRLRADPDQDQMAVLVDELADERSRLESLQVGDDDSTSVRAVFSWSYEDLTADVARVFRFCGLHPGYDFDSYAIAAMLDTDVRTARRGLETLQRCHLIERGTSGRFALHDLLWTYAAELALANYSESERQEAFGRLCDYYLGATATAIVTTGMFQEAIGHSESLQQPLDIPLLQDDACALAWLDTERPNLVLVAFHAANHDRADVATSLSKLLVYYLDVTRHRADADRLHNCALAAARASGNVAAEATAVRALGLLSVRRLRYDQAEQHFEEALRLHQQLDDTTGRAAVFNGLGTACKHLGRVGEAVDHLERSIALYRHSDPSLRRTPLLNLGVLHYDMGRFETSFACLEETVQLAEDARDRGRMASALIHLVQVCRDTGRHDKAFEDGQRALALVREIGDPASESNVRTQLGMLYRRLGDADAAREHHQEALRTAEAIGADDLVATSHCGLAELHVDAGQYRDALTCYESAIGLVSGGPWEELVRAHVGAGDTCELLGDLTNAVAHWQRAHDIYRDVQHSEADGLAVRIERACAT